MYDHHRGLYREKKARNSVLIFFFFFLKRSEAEMKNPEKMRGGSDGISLGQRNRFSFVPYLREDEGENFEYKGTHESLPEEEEKDICVLRMPRRNA